MIGTILSIFGSTAFKGLTNKLLEAYQLRLNAQTDQEKLEAELTIKQLEARQELLLAEQKRWFTAWIRPLMALPIVIYIWKIVVYDTVLGLGITPNPGEFVNWLVLTIVGAYFITRPFERK